MKQQDVTRYSFPGPLCTLLSSAQLGSCATCWHLGGHISVSTRMGLAVANFFKTTFIMPPETKEIKLTICLVLTP